MGFKLSFILANMITILQSIILLVHERLNEPFFSMRALLGTENKQENTTFRALKKIVIPSMHLGMFYTFDWNPGYSVH